MPAKARGPGWFGFFLGVLAAFSQLLSARAEPLYERHWFETRTAHFHTYSCGETQEVARLAARLEQFRDAYSVLAGQQAVASPPIVVMAFPDHRSMEPFLPLYQGKPANLTAFFKPGSDENLIVLPLDSGVSLEAVFHEYTHLLLRHNDPFWPLWLKEGMAEIYGTIEVTGPHTVLIGKPLSEHLRLLAEQPPLPLHDLFAVTHDSPEYNERERQGIFYAESWLLAHYLMVGDHAAHRMAFSQLTALLRQGQLPEEAFTNAFRATPASIENELHRYLARGKLESLPLSLTLDLTAPQSLFTRPLAPVEVCFRLGDELLQINRPETAEIYFLRAERLAPRSPLPFEGRGLLAAERDQAEEAIRLLAQALGRGSVSFLAHYVYAAQKFRLASGSADHFVRVKGEVAKEIRSELQKSLSLMPDFGGAHHLIGIFELVQQEDAASAEKHLQRAIQLEPENLSYLLSFAQAQLLREDVPAARRTLDLLRRPYVNSQLRVHAQELLQEINQGEHTRSHP
jgi:tetratricopeptide (TPR) repeat protein